LLAVILALCPGQQYQFQCGGCGEAGMHSALLALSFAVSCEQVALATDKQTNKQKPRCKQPKTTNETGKNKLYWNYVEIQHIYSCFCVQLWAPHE
jgi:hypothetical protein